MFAKILLFVSTVKTVQNNNKLINTIFLYVSSGIIIVNYTFIQFMKIKQIKEIMIDFSYEEKALTFSRFSSKFPNSYYPGKPENYWIKLNLEYIRDNAEQIIDFADSNEQSKNLALLTYLMAFSQNHNNESLLKLLKQEKLENKILDTIKIATYLKMNNTARSNYYFTFTDCLKNNFFDLNDLKIQEQMKAFYKKATVDNNKRYYSEGLCSIAAYVYDNKENLDKSFVLEMLEYFLVTGKYVKANLNKILAMSSWREEQLSMQSDTIEAFSIVKKLNPVRIGVAINQDKPYIDRMIEKLHKYLTKKLYTQEQYVNVDLSEKAGDKILTITYENKTANIITASEFISYCSTHALEEKRYDEIFDKIFLKNKITDKLPEKSKNENRLKI